MTGRTAEWNRTTLPGRSWARWLALTVVLAVIVSACGGGDGAAEVSAEERAASLVSEIPAPTDDAAQVEDTFVGLTEDGAIAVALAVKDGAAVAYICDGVELGHWFKGSADDGQVDLEHAAGTRIKAEIADDEASGEVTLSDGSQLAFTAAKAEGEHAAFFRSTDLKSGFVHGWIVVPTGADQVSVRGLGTEGKTRVIDSAIVVDDVVPSEDPVPPKKDIELSGSLGIVIPEGQFTCDQLETSYEAVAFVADNVKTAALKLAYSVMALDYANMAIIQECAWMA